jgi:hypothetical protein
MPRDGVELLAEGVNELIRGVFRGGMSLFGLGSQGRARGRAARQARADERASRRQRQEWFDVVERQKTRGDAGNATQEEAREALRGRGGRPNPLDERRFR